MPTDDRPEDIANREFYNHMPTRMARVTFECAIRVDPDSPEPDTLSFATDPMGLYGPNVRNVVPISAEFISGEVRYLDGMGNEVEPRRDFHPSKRLEADDPRDTEE